MNKLQEFFDGLDYEEQLTILEVAFQTLNNEDRYDWVAEIMDVSDDVLMPVLVKLQAGYAKG